MITESGRVVAIERDGVWVETANQSACGRCAARKGCGQSLLAQMDGHRSYIKASYNGFQAEDFNEHQTVTIGIHESAVLRGSLLVYSLPLLGLVVGATIAHLLRWSEPFAVFAAVAGMVLMALVVNRLSRRIDSDPRFQPVVIEPRGEATVLNASDLSAASENRFPS